MALLLAPQRHFFVPCFVEPGFLPGSQPADSVTGKDDLRDVLDRDRLSVLRGGFVFPASDDHRAGRGVQPGIPAAENDRAGGHRSGFADLVGDGDFARLVKTQ